MKFCDVVGQTALKQQLIRTVKENRISHAQLFAGPEGAGGLAMALAYAQFICCEQRQDDDSCGICSSCLKYTKLIHPDLHFVFPVVNTSQNSKAVSDDYISEWRKTVAETPYFNLNAWINKIAAENKQGGIFERESTEIIRKLNLKTYEAEYKIMVIWMPEKMNSTAANKLLKMIEEPPSKTLFLLISESPGSLLATILSRCQYIKFSPIAENDIKEALSNQIQDSNKVTEISRIASGNYFKALELLNESDENTSNLVQFQSLMRFAFARNVPELMSWAEGMAGIGREKQKKFITQALHLVRENFSLNMAGGSVNYMNKSEMDFSKKFHPFINERNIFNISEEFNRAAYHIESNGNGKIIFLDMALKMVKYIRQ